MDKTPRFNEFIRNAFEAGATDLLLVAGAPATVYIDGKMSPLFDERLKYDEIERLLLEVMDQKQVQRLRQERDINFALGMRDIGRIRVNVHYQRGSLAAAVRFIPITIPSMEELNLPLFLRELAELPRGLVLITGGTGTGKSTTLAAMIEHINSTLARHIITLEDPIEYTFSHNKALIEQREVGEDSPAFASALRNVVRQKPDVILVGEIRDRETIGTALTAAETGHLVLATLHTITAAQTIERIVDVFDPQQQPQIRVQLATTLRAVVCQSLFTNERDGGLVPAMEIMIITQAIRRAIRDNETHLITGMIETGTKFGMQTLDSAIAALARDGIINQMTAISRAVDPDRMEKMLPDVDVTAVRQVETATGIFP